jgi:hypothetical protein
MDEGTHDGIGAEIGAEIEKHLYLAVLIGSVVATGLNVAPVAYHRILFRRHRRRAAGLGVVVGGTVALVAAAAVLAFLLVLWGAVPWWSVSLRRRDSAPPQRPTARSSWALFIFDRPLIPLSRASW